MLNCHVNLYLTYQFRREVLFKTYKWRFLPDIKQNLNFHVYEMYIDPLEYADSRELEDWENLEKRGQNFDSRSAQSFAEFDHTSLSEVENTRSPLPIHTHKHAREMNSLIMNLNQRG